MKRLFACFLITAIMLSLLGCDRSYVTSLDIKCVGDGLSIRVDEETADSYSFYYDALNDQPMDRYSNIDFLGTENRGAIARVHKFEILSSVSSRYSLSLELVDANKYVVDYLRVAIVLDGEVRVYKYYDVNESIYSKEDDPDSIIHFESESTIFSNLTIDVISDEGKEVTVFIWIEEAELYTSSGERLKGWVDHSYHAAPIYLDLEIK